MRDGERVEDALGHAQGLTQREGPLLGDPSAQVGPGDVLHREVARPAVDALVEDRDETGVGEAGSAAGLPPEARDERPAGVSLGEVRVHDLERDLPVEPTVDGEVHGGHAAARDPGDDLVAPADHAADERIGDGGSHARQSTGEGGRNRGAWPRQAKRVMRVCTFAT